MMTKSRVSMNPALRELEMLIGEWEMELSNARFLPDPAAKLNGSAAFDLIEGGAFLVLRQGSRESGPPHASWIIGRDESREDFVAFYCDDRGVSRTYSMSFTGREWSIWRDAPGFDQRFVATISDDRRTIDGSWQMSEDGETWIHDFDLTYRRKTDGS